MYTSIMELYDTSPIEHPLRRQSAQLFNSSFLCIFFTRQNQKLFYLLSVRFMIFCLSENDEVNLQLGMLKLCYDD